MSEPIWWCVEHGDVGNKGRCGWQWINIEEGGCEMVQRRLVPGDALVLMRAKDGRFSPGARNIVAGALLNAAGFMRLSERYNRADAILDALATEPE